MKNYPIEKSNMNTGSRRSFIKNTAVASFAIASSDFMNLAEIGNSDTAKPEENAWYKRITRWGQTNITEKDPPEYDIAWWRKHWKNTGVDGVIINAGGIVAYYPSKIPLHKQAIYLAGRDLFGELSKAAHEDGITVFARRLANQLRNRTIKTRANVLSKDARP